ncbi:MAG: hypothetical protein EP330_13315 [Deltaproteobacteria bacterium]|nr:MAG: hypothetical protein EP330_13315 [Deltaproteobacteria bacterium]
MSKARFTLPAGVDLSVADDKLNVRYDGDVSLEQSMGLELGTVEAGGDLHIALERITGSLKAGGSISLEGTIDAESISAPSLSLPGGASVRNIQTDGDLEAGDLHAREVSVGGQVKAGVIAATGAVAVGGNVAAEKISARTVTLTGGSIRAKAIEASESIKIGAAKLQVDVLIAPKVEIDPTASGRVTVIESYNERGASKIKGGLSVADYDEIIGGADEFLQERGVAKLGEAATVENEPEDIAEDEAEDEPEEAPAEESPTIEEPAPLEVADIPVDDEDDEDPLSVSVEDLEPVEQPADDGLSEKLAEAMEKIRSCYSAGEAPPAVEELGSYIDAGSYDELRGTITQIWTGLIDFHQRKGIRPPHQVTHAFNVIHGLVQEAG